MSISVLVAIAGVLAAAVGTGLLAGQCIRSPRTSFIAWTVGMFALTVALLAQSIGFATGFGALTFRVIQLSAQLAAPLMLAWGLVELVGRSTAVRFGARLITAGLAVVVGVVLATDPLAAKPFAKTWPSASAHYQIIPHYALILLHLAVAVAAVTVLAVCATRGHGAPVPASAPRLPGVAAVAVAALLLVALRFALPGPAYPALSAIAAGLLWSGMSRIGDLTPRPAQAAAGRPPAGPPRGTRGAGRARAMDGAGKTRGADADPGERVVARPPAADDFDAPEFPPVGRASPRRGERGGRNQRDGRRRYQPGAPGAEPATGAIDVSAPGLSEIPLPMPVPVLARGAESGPAPGTDLAVPVTPPHGLIAIYTLLEDKVADFDRAADEVAEQVRANEPDTLVYVIHTVPKAPMQRIFYEVYRDRAAYDRHEKQPYVKRFVTARRPYVLATNVIELRLKYAKVSPLPQAEAQAAQAQAQAQRPAGAPNLPAVRNGTGSGSGPAPDRAGAGPRGRSGSRGQPGRDPGYVPREPGYSPREPRAPGYSPREPREPGYSAREPREPGYYSPRDPGYAPHESPRDPGYPPREPGYVPREPGDSGRDPGYGGRGPATRGPRQAGEPPAAPRYGRI